MLNNDELVDLYLKLGSNASAVAKETGMIHSTVYRRLVKSGIIIPKTDSEWSPPHQKKDKREDMWGLGGPALIGPVRPGQDETIAGLFDIHYPKHDKVLFGKAVRLLAELMPDTVILGGDIRDDAILSRWEAHKRSKMPVGKLFNVVRRDMDETSRNILMPIREACPGSRIVFIEGNHDERLRHWLSDDLQEGVEMAKEWMFLSEYDISWHPRCGILLRDEFLARHGRYLSIHTAKNEHDKTRCSGWSGHAHKRSVWFHSFPETGRRYEWNSAPCMCRNDYDYGAGQSGLAPWDHGFLFGTIGGGSEYDHVTECAAFFNGVLRFRGEKF